MTTPKPQDRASRANHPKNLSDEIIRFASFSSIRGLPRSLKARSWGWTFVWLFAVAGFLVVAGYFCVNLVKQFCDFHTFYETSSVFQSKEAPFPSVTICNLQPFSSSLLDRILKTSPISEDVNARLLLSRYSQLVEQLGETEQRTLSWKSFFMQNWGHKVSLSDGLQFDEFVLNGTCKFTYANKSRLATRDCNFSVDVIPVFSSTFFTCFSLSPPESLENFVYSLEMDLYLDTESQLLNSTSDHRTKLFTLDDSVGAFVTVHTPGTYPDGSHGVHVHPGTKSVIEIVSTKREEKINDLFSSPCTDTQTMQLMATNSTQHEFTYKSTVCRSALVQQEIVTNCSCVDADLPIRPEWRHLPFCGQLNTKEVTGEINSTDFTDTLKRFRCATRIELDTDSEEVGNQNCPLSCVYVSYSTTAYQSLWPPKANELDFYRANVKGRPLFAGRFSTYADADAAVDAGNSTLAMQLLNSNSDDKIRDNFLRLLIFRPDLSLIISKEQYQITPEALVSQIGGTFSLWAGLTVITAVELLELVYYVCKALLLMICSRNGRWRGSAPVTNNALSMDDKT